MRSVHDDMTQERTRTRKIILPAGSTGAEIDSIIESFNRSEFILGHQLNDNVLAVDYIFPEHTFAEVWNIITGHISYRKFKLLLRLKYSVMSYTEINEQSHQLVQCGWQTDIYITHHHIARQLSHKKKLWQNYLQSSRQKSRKAETPK